MHSAEKKMFQFKQNNKQESPEDKGKVHLATHQGLSVITQWDLAVLLCLH